MQSLESYHSLANVNVLPKMAMVLTIAVGARLTEGRGERREGRLKGSNHKEQEQRRFVGTLYITPPSPGPFCLLVSLKILTHVCFRYLIPNGKMSQRGFLLLPSRGVCSEKKYTQQKNILGCRQKNIHIKHYKSNSDLLATLI